MIRLSNLEVKKNGEVIAKANTLHVRPQENVLIVGGNGSGKTTILKVIAGLETTFTGQLVNKFDPCETTYVHQEPVMLRGTLQQNISYGMRARGISLDQQQEQIQHWARVLGIGALLENQAQNLSGGEKKKAAMARALLIKPKLLLLDEPLGELDDQSGSVLVEELLKLEETTIVAASPVPDPRLAAFRPLALATC